MNSLDETVGIELVTVLDTPVLDDNSLKKKGEKGAERDGSATVAKQGWRGGRMKMRNEQQP